MDIFDIVYPLHVAAAFCVGVLVGALACGAGYNLQARRDQKRLRDELWGGKKTADKPARLTPRIPRW